jgi:hypothetical protein
VTGLVISAVGAILLTQTGIDTSYAALPLPALILRSTPKPDGGAVVFYVQPVRSTP